MPRCDSIPTAQGSKAWCSGCATHSQHKGESSAVSGHQGRCTATAPGTLGPAATHPTHPSAVPGCRQADCQHAVLQGLYIDPAMSTKTECDALTQCLSAVHNDTSQPLQPNQDRQTNTRAASCAQASETDTKGLQGSTHTRHTGQHTPGVQCILMPLLCFVHIACSSGALSKLPATLCRYCAGLCAKHTTAGLFATHNSSQGQAHLQRQEECK